MTVDLDALEALYRDDKKRPVGTIGQADVLALIAELRRERERADEAEREAEEITTAWLDKDRQIAKAETALSRAEEAIEKVRRADGTTSSWDDFGHRVLDILTEYDKQKGADRD